MFFFVHMEEQPLLCVMMIVSWEGGGQDDSRMIVVCEMHACLL